uniref:BTB domain-containing protein n=1 Tax=Macrostomum lignano TaxID=282301 RepID=A0A1I8JRW1_9PLAT
FQLPMSGKVPSSSAEQQNAALPGHLRPGAGSSSLSVAAADLEDSVMFRDKRLFLVAFPSFERIRRQGKLCDVTLRVAGSKFSAHRVVLAASIPFFYGMFMHDMKECAKGEVEMQGIEANALELLINFAYTGEVQITCENVQELFSGASYLQVPRSRTPACDFMRAPNVAEVCRFAQQFDCQPLVAECQAYMTEHFTQLAATEEFKALTLDELTGLLIRDEVHVYQAGLRWLCHRQPERQSAALAVLRCIRLTQLPPACWRTSARTRLFRNSLECRDLLDDAKAYFLLPERRFAQLHADSASVLPERLRLHLRCCGGLTSSGDSISTVECYDPGQKQWRMLRPNSSKQRHSTNTPNGSPAAQVAENMTTHRSRVGVAVLNGRLYAIGGYDGKDPAEHCRAVRPRRRQWRRVAPMNCKRSALGAAALIGKLYVCGGYDGVSSLRSCEVYWPERDQWHMMPNMADCRSAGGVDPVWRTVAPMRNRRCRHGVAALGDKIYVAGGYDGLHFLNTVEYYCPATNEWTLAASLNALRSR